MSEIPEHSYHDSESSESEKDSVCEIFDTVINFLECIYEDVPKDSSIFKDLVKKYKPVIDVLKQAKDSYDQSPEYLEVRYDFDEVSSRLREEFNKEYKASLDAFISSLDKIFPAKIAEVNVPKYCNLEEHKIPKVKKFQRNNKLNRDDADSEYKQLTLKTKRSVIDRIYKKDSTSSSVEFGVSRPEYDPVREKTHHLVELLTNFSMLKSRNESGARMERIEAFFNYERDLEWTKTILDCANEMRDLDEELLARKYTEIVFEENCSNVRTLARSIVEEKAKLILEGELRVLSEKFTTYKVAPKIATESLNKAKKRKKQSRQDNCEVSDQNIKATEVNLKVGDYIELSHETFPWLDDEMAKVLYIKRSGNGVTVVVDARTEAAKRIEHRMSGYETKKKQKSILPSLYNKLKLAAEIVATSDSGLRDSWTTLRYRDKNKYPFSIFSWKAQTSDALRMYVSHIAMDKVDDESVRKILEENGVTHLLMLLGACDKNNQEELLPVFTGRTRRIEAADGAGV